MCVLFWVGHSLPRDLKDVEVEECQNLNLQHTFKPSEDVDVFCDFRW